MKISLCMIVKNEEKYITMCLENALNLVDEVVIVDTGSTDKTKDLIKNFGEKVKVFDYKWNSNFSEARNISIEKATGDWILMLDADEKILCDVKKLRGIIENGKKDGYIIPFYNIVGDSGFEYSEVYIKIFKNNGYRYSGAIHEQLHIMMDKVDVIDQDVCKIIHYGYMSSEMVAKDKAKRNLTILKVEYERNPEDPFVNYNLGVSYSCDGNHREALKHYIISNNILQNTISDSSVLYEKDMIKRIAQSLFGLEEFDNCIYFLENILKEEQYNNFVDLYFILGNCYLEKDNFENALKNYNTCINIGESRDYVSRQGIGSYLPQLMIAKVYAKQSRVMDVTRYYIEAIFNPNNIAKHGLNEARAYLKENKLFEILDELNNLINKGNISNT